MVLVILARGKEACFALSGLAIRDAPYSQGVTLGWIIERLSGAQHERA